MNCKGGFDEGQQYCKAQGNTCNDDSCRRIVNRCFEYNIYGICQKC